MTFSAAASSSAALQARLLARLQSWRDAPLWLVALSGGLDSSVLLELLCQLRSQQALPRLQAIHIHHGLQAVADDWVLHCENFCAARGVPLQVVRVQVDAGPASSGRRARRVTVPSSRHCRPAACC